MDEIQALLKKQFTQNYHISQPLPASALLAQQDIKRKEAEINKSPSNNYEDGEKRKKKPR